MENELGPVPETAPSGGRRDSPRWAPKSAFAEASLQVVKVLMALEAKTATAA
jgi:hypothetical protein